VLFIGTQFSNLYTTVDTPARGAKCPPRSVSAQSLLKVRHTTGWALGTAGCWVSTSPSGYVAAFGEAGVPTRGLEGGVGCNPRVTFDRKVQNLGPCVFEFDSPLPLSTAYIPLHLCELGGGSASIPGTSVYRGSKRGRRVCVCLLLQYLIQSCSRGGRRMVEDMCYEIRRAEACVD
jgi:hypothetical protein